MPLTLQHPSSSATQAAEPDPACSAPAAGLRWEEARCPLCAHETNTPRLSLGIPPGADRPVSAVACAACGHLFLNPRPDAASMVRWIHDGCATNQFRIRTEVGGFALRERLFNRLFVARRDRERVDALRGLVPGLGPDTRVLDFGCGTGSFLSCLRESLGCQVWGIEEGPEALRQLQSRGIPVLASVQELRALQEPSFDAITLCHVLEHLYHPIETLTELATLSTSRTRLIVEVPNFESWPRALFGRHWLGWRVPEHLSFFTPATLRTTLEGAGWTCERLLYPPQVIGTVYSLGLLLRRPWLEDLHGHLFQILAGFVPLAPLGPLLSWCRRNDFLIAVARLAEPPTGTPPRTLERPDHNSAR